MLNLTLMSLFVKHYTRKGKGETGPLPFSSPILAWARYHTRGMAEKIARYALLSALNNDDLVESVETALKEGWEPLGAPFVYLRESKELGLQPKRELMQAMVMRGNEVKNQRGITAQ